ncbi:unnamed protein product, partial [Mesorhabditis belari]|uniref:Arrestin C-terminal-like domain-containing protein n=1 Tax=Mesorhabditis belari TaxID=2138241 RepID=A0AAF3FGX3_9BILA
MDFCIHFSRCPPIYFPGENVIGHVVICSKQTQEARQVLIKAVGVAKNNWNVNKQGGFWATLDVINEESRSWGKCAEQPFIPSGELQIPFNFLLPLKSLPTFGGKDFWAKGKISYLVQVVVDTGRWALNKTSEAEFTVGRVSDLRLSPSVFNEISVIPKAVNIGLPLLKKGFVSLKASIPRKGCILREILPVTVTIDNASSSMIDELEIQFVQRVIFLAWENVNARFSLDDSFQMGPTIGHNNRRTTDKILETKKTAVQVSSKDTGVFTIPIEIPTVIASFECAITSVTYHLKITSRSTETIKSSVSCELPLVVGNIGLEGNQSETKIAL